MAYDPNRVHSDVASCLDEIARAVKGEEVRGSIYDAIELIDARSVQLETDIRSQAEEFIEEDSEGIMHGFIGNLCVRFDLDNNSASKSPVNIQNELGNNRTILANVKYDGVYRYGMTCKVNIVGPELNNMHVIAFAPLSDGSNIEIFDIAFGAQQSGIIVSYNRTLVPISGGGGGSYTEGDGIDINNDEISVKLRSSNPGLAFDSNGNLYATGGGSSYVEGYGIDITNDTISADAVRCKLRIDQQGNVTSSISGDILYALINETASIYEGHTVVFDVSIANRGTFKNLQAEVSNTYQPHGVRLHFHEVTNTNSGYVVYEFTVLLPVSGYTGTCTNSTVTIQPKLTAGTGIDITNDVVSVDDTLMIRGLASGSIASFDDGGNDMPLKSCIVNIEPVQSGSGDPSPSNVRPITGWTECNLYNNKKNFLKTIGTTTTLGNVLFTVNNDGTCTTNGTANGWNAVYRNFGQAKLKANTPYILTSEGRENDLLCVSLYNGDTRIATTQYADYVNFTLEEDATCELRVIVYYNTTVSNRTIKPMIRLASETDEDFKPYQGNTYNIEFPSEAGTVYGGTLDVTNGVLIVDRVMVDLGTLSYSMLSVTQGTLFRGDLVGIKRTSGSGKMPNILCSNYKTTTQTDRANLTISQPTASANVDIIDNSYSSASDFKTAMNGVQLVYELATPVTYNLTPTEIKTLLGINNIFADCGDVDVEYTRDATSIINWLIDNIGGDLPQAEGGGF